MKELVGQEIARMVKDGDTIGVGTGSTVDAALVAIGDRIQKERLSIRAVTTSYQSAWRCEEIGFTVLHPEYMGKVDWGFDGADAVDSQLRAIKGRGAALLEEKIVAKLSRSYFLIVDESKVTEDICQLCAVPVEVTPSARRISEQGLKHIGATEITLRNAVSTKHGPVITERGNIIIDAKFENFRPGLEAEIKSIVGVVESGVFENYAGM